MSETPGPGRLLVCALEGPELLRHEEAALRELAPAGVILFARNLKSPAQVRDLVAGIRESCPAPAFVSLDQEGGTVNRLASVDPVFLRLPPARVQAAWPAGRLRAAWRAVGGGLRALGIDVAFAPVVDLDGGDGRNAIGPRSFGTDPERVVACAREVLAGLGEAGVAGCLKHFPGLGGTDLDTHRALAESPLSAAELWERHALPYRLLREEAPLVMTSHAWYPALDPGEPLPGTFSRTLLSGWLRERAGYGGVVISDDLGMGAVAGRGSPGELAAAAFRAGVDLALFCRNVDDPLRARDHLAAQLEKGGLDPRKWEAAGRRLAALLARPGAGESPLPLPAWEIAVAAFRETC